MKLYGTSIKKDKSYITSRNCSGKIVTSGINWYSNFLDCQKAIQHEIDYHVYNRNAHGARLKNIDISAMAKPITDTQLASFDSCQFGILVRDVPDTFLL